ncbi:MAG: hypothetical protein KIT02_07760 [Devosia sp.]|nr:hypothetical protein [Devosia sp.]UYO01085.1 MAG: hypothetical protein KIT02_07760 [Devosia sp.]
MNSLFQSIGAVRPNWMQHHLPWLGVLALLFGLADDAAERDSDETG